MNNVACRQANMTRHGERVASTDTLINILLGAFAIGIIPAMLVVSGDAAGAAHNIQTHELLYRLSLVAHVLVTVTNVPLALIFMSCSGS